MTLRRLALFGIPALVIIAVAAFAAWWFFVREDNQLATSAPAIPEDLAQASASTPAGTTASSGGDSLTFRIISDRSEAAYFTDEKLAALPLPSKAKGSTNQIQGEFHLASDGISLDSTKTSSFTVDLTTLKSDKDMRDRRVQSQALETSTYPTARFTAKSVTGYDPSILARNRR
jgi:polyisoprenoid-binding protein YceI